MSDDELLTLARKCLAGDSPEAIGRALVEFRAVLGPEETIALIERHRAEVERLTRERDAWHKQQLAKSCAERIGHMSNSNEKAIEAACIRAFMATPTAWAVPGDDWATVGDPTKENYRIIVRAAIAAFLRAVEPSEKMGKAAYNATEDGYGVTAAQDAWRAMCRALAGEIDNAKG